MDTTVITHEPIDYGTGKADHRVVIVDSKFTVDDTGALHVWRASNNVGNVASFPAGSWLAALRGELYVDSGSTLPTFGGKS